MKEDKLEEWIKRNRSALDVEKPDEEVIWEGIRGGLAKKKSRPPSWLYWAAVILPIIGLSSYFFFFSRASTNMEELPAYSSINLTTLNPELAVLETNYQEEISTKWAAIEQEKFDEEQLDFLFDELGILEEMNQEFQSDISQVENERLVQTLIDYYEKKTRLLEKILVGIERQKRQKNERRTIEL
jgi:hypothetical protein